MCRGPPPRCAAARKTPTAPRSPTSAACRGRDPSGGGPPMITAESYLLNAAALMTKPTTGKRGPRADRMAAAARAGSGAGPVTGSRSRRPSIFRVRVLRLCGRGLGRVPVLERRGGLALGPGERVDVVLEEAGRTVKAVTGARNASAASPLRPSVVSIRWRPLPASASSLPRARSERAVAPTAKALPGISAFGSSVRPSSAICRP